MMMKSDVLFGFWKEGEPAHEFWIARSFSDSEDEDCDNTDPGAFFGVVNPDGYFSDSPDGCDSVVYPGHDFPDSRYRHAHLRNFSRAAIKQYNQDTGNTFEFVELVEASVGIQCGHVVVTFKACQASQDRTMVTTSFRAETHNASESFSDSYDIETFVPLQSDSDVSSASDSDASLASESQAI